MFEPLLHRKNHYSKGQWLVLQGSSVVTFNHRAQTRGINRIKDLICKVQSSSLCFRAWHHFEQIQARVPCESVAARRNTLMTTRTSPSQRNRKKRRCPKQRIPRPDTNSVITKIDRKTCGSQDGCSLALFLCKQLSGSSLTWGILQNLIYFKWLVIWMCSIYYALNLFGAQMPPRNDVSDILIAQAFHAKTTGSKQRARDSKKILGMLGSGCKSQVGKWTTVFFVKLNHPSHKLMICR